MQSDVTNPQRGRRLLGDTLLFGISSFGSRILLLLLTPLYTSLLTKAEYGTADLLQITITFLYPLLTLATADAAMRFAMDKAVRREAVLGNALLFVLLASLITACTYPLIRAVFISFQKYKLTQLNKVKFIGLDNYIEVFDDPNLWMITKNTLNYVVIVVGAQFILGFKDGHFQTIGIGLETTESRIGTQHGGCPPGGEQLNAGTLRVELLHERAGQHYTYGHNAHHERDKLGTHTVHEPPGCMGAILLLHLAHHAGEALRKSALRKHIAQHIRHAECSQERIQRPGCPEERSVDNLAEQPGKAAAENSCRGNQTLFLHGSHNSQT